MSDLDPRDRALIERARGGHDPTDDDRRRVRRAIAAGVGVGAGLGVTTTTASAGASAVVKAIAALGIASALGVTGWAAYRGAFPPDSVSPAPAPETASARPTPSPRSTPPLERAEDTAAAPRSPVPAVPPLPLPTVPPPAAALPPERAPDPPLPRHSFSEPPAATRVDSQLHSSDAPPRGADAPVATPPVAGTAASVVTLPLAGTAAPVVTPAADEGRSRVASGLGPNAGDVADETRIIGEGIAARRSGDAARALALFDEHARRYPGGVLGDERDVERVLALCDLGRRDVARAAAARFERTRLGSPLVARIHASCAGPSIR